MKYACAGIAAAGFASIALALAPAATAGPEEDYLVAVAAANITNLSPQQLVALGQTVCTDRAAGIAFNATIQRIAASNGLNPAQASVVVSAATAAFCPQLF